MNSTDLVGFNGSFTDDETCRITEAIEGAEARFTGDTSQVDVPKVESALAAASMPPWFVVKDDIPGQSTVIITHRVGSAGAVVSHSVDELIERLDAYTGEV
jgi:hypothetical protein